MENIKVCFTSVVFNVDLCYLASPKKYVHYDIMIKCREFVTVHANFLKTFSILLVFYCKLYEHSALGYYLDYGRIGEQQLSNIWPELNPPDAYTGRLYQTYVALSNLTDYDIRFLVSIVCLY